MGFQERRKLLVDALRSGNYKQTSSVLNRRDEEFCCLGVACEIYTQNVGGVTKIESLLGRISYSIDGEGNEIVLPVKVKEWYGFNDAEATFATAIRGYGSLTGLNDGGASFETIADIIEAQPAGMFHD